MGIEELADVSGTVAVSSGKRTCTVAELDERIGLSNRPKLQRTARDTVDGKSEESNGFVLGQELSDLYGKCHTILMARQYDDVILYTSDSSVIPHILLSPPEKTDTQDTHPMNTTPLQDQAFGNALVVLSSDPSRRILYINVPLPKDDPFVTKLTFSDFRAASDFSELDDDSDSSLSSTDSEESSDDNSTSRLTCPIPDQLSTFFSNPEYNDFYPDSSTDLGYVSESGYFSSYRIMNRCHGPVEDGADFGGFFKDF